MMAPPTRSAISSANADLPLAVGPAIRIASFSRPLPFFRAESSMSLIATLISHPAERALTSSLVDMASRAVMATATRWLAPDVACDIALTDGLDAQGAEHELRATLASTPIDIVVQPAEGRRKRMLIADMDSTIIDQECIDELADEVGLKDHVAAITARSMNGEIAFEPALRERVALLKGLDISVIDRIIDNSTDPCIWRARTGCHDARTTAPGPLWYPAGSPRSRSALRQKLGFDENRANTLLETEGKLTGQVAEPILGRAAKAIALNEIAARLGISPQDAIAVGDGANDLDMLMLAGSGVALHAKPAVAEQARIRINHGDLTALLYIQGYAEADFVR